jgi:hypothetical protein
MVCQLGWIRGQPKPRARKDSPKTPKLVTKASVKSKGSTQLFADKDGNKKPRLDMDKPEKEGARREEEKAEGQGEGRGKRQQGQGEIDQNVDEEEGNDKTGTVDGALPLQPVTPRLLHIFKAQVSNTSNNNPKQQHTKALFRQPFKTKVSIVCLARNNTLSVTTRDLLQTLTTVEVEVPRPDSIKDQIDLTGPSETPIVTLRAWKFVMSKKWDRLVALGTVVAPHKADRRVTRQAGLAHLVESLCQTGVLDFALR